MHKIEIYQRIAAIRNKQHLEQLLDELIDRFGEPPEEVMNLLTVARIKNIARHLGLKSIIQQPMQIEFIFSDVPNVEMENYNKIKSFICSIYKSCSWAARNYSYAANAKLCKKYFEICDENIDYFSSNREEKVTGSLFNTMNKFQYADIYYYWNRMSEGVEKGG